MATSKHELGGETFTALNNALAVRYEEGNPLRMEVAGKPKLHIVSFEPLQCETFGMIRNRAPRVAGVLALRTIIVSPPSNNPADSLIFAGLETESKQGYGYWVSGQKVIKQTIDDVAQALGHPEYSPFSTK